MANYKSLIFSEKQNRREKSVEVRKKIYSLDGNLDFQVDYPFLWIASWTNGLIKYNLKTKESQSFLSKKVAADEPCSNTLTRILIDPMKNIWIGSAGNGVSYIDNQTRIFTNHIHQANKSNTLSSTQIRDVYQDRKGDIWIGTHFGLNRYDQISNSFESYYSQKERAKENPLNDFIISLCQDDEGNLWVGTLAGLNLFHPSKKTFSLFSILPKDDVLTNNQIWTIYKDSSGCLWIGTRQGVFHMDPRTKRYSTYFFDTDNSPATPNKNSATCFLEENHRVWIGTKDGIVRINKDKSLTFFNENQKGLTSRLINQIFRDKQNNIWICSSNGFFRYISDEKGFERHLNSDYFNHVQFFNIRQDKDDNLWLVSSKDLFQYNPNTQKYYILSPLDKAFASGPSSTGFLIDAQNYAYVGNSNGLTTFSISDLKTKIVDSNIHFTKLSLFNIEQHPMQEGSPLRQPIDLINEIVLTYQQNFFSIDYVSVNLTQGNQLQYSYILEGFDKDWIDAGSRTTAYYTQVPPGKYFFKVKLAGSYDEAENPIKSISIHIKKPFYATWYAYLFYGVIVVLLMYFFRRYSLINIKEKNKLLLRQIEKEKEEDIYDMKVKFFMNISHEFRTPLTLINGPLEKLLEGEKNQEKKRLLLLMEKNARKLLHLIDQLLEFRKAETGTRKMLVSCNDIINNTNEIICVFEELAERQAIHLELKTNLDPLQVWFDVDMYEKILFNLLSNSFKNTPSGGRISVYITTFQKEVPISRNKKNPFTERNKLQTIYYVKISVEDTGCGIPADKIPYIFDRFFQVKEEKSSTGIGLSLVKNLVELHQGYIVVESEEKIETRFDLYLPLGKDHFKQENILSDHQQESYVVSSKPVDLLHLSSDIYHQIEEENKLHFSDEIHKQRQSILIVEDNPDIVLLLKEALSDSYQVYAAENGKLGLHKAMKYLPHLIICDINMPLMNGIELTESLKKDEKTAHIPIILVTALSEAEYEIKGLEYGADDFISKPFNMNILRLKIKNLLSTIKEQQKKTNSKIIMKEFGPQNIESENDFIEKFNGYLRENLSDPNIDVDMIVEKMNTSRSQLYRKIKTLTGMPVKIYVRTYRLAYAKKLMENPNIRISEVMDSVGINSRSYFIKSFKELYNINPSDYQKKYLHSQD